jgi:hypothetical protein
LIEAFSDRYFPAELQQTFLTAANDSLRDIEGTYMSTRRADSTILKLFALFGQSHARIDKEGVLHVDSMKDLRGHPYGWKPIGPDLWQQVDDQGKLFAIRGANGKIARIAGAFAAGQIQRVPWYENDRVVLMTLGFCALVGICVLFNMLLRLARRHLFRSSQPVAPADRAPLTAWCKTSVTYWLGVLISLALLFHLFEDDSLPPTSEWDKFFLLGDVLLAIAVLMSVGTAVSAWRIWRRPAVNRISQVKFTLVAFACLYFSWFAIHWHAITPVHRF